LQVLLAIIAAAGDIGLASFYRREPARDPAKAGVGRASTVVITVGCRHSLAAQTFLARAPQNKSLKKSGIAA
jgi:hypothetical protein